MSFCMYCGTRIPDGGSYCPECGKLAVKPAAPKPEAVPVPDDDIFFDDIPAKPAKAVKPAPAAEDDIFFEKEPVKPVNAPEPAAEAAAEVSAAEPEAPQEETTGEGKYNGFNYILTCGQLMYARDVTFTLGGSKNLGSFYHIRFANGISTANIISPDGATLLYTVDKAKMLSLNKFKVMKNGELYMMIETKGSQMFITKVGRTWVLEKTKNFLDEVSFHLNGTEIAKRAITNSGYEWYFNNSDFKDLITILLSTDLVYEAAAHSLNRG